MRAEGRLERFQPDSRSGAKLLVTDRAAELERRFKRTMTRYGAALDRVAEALGRRNVMDLERLATAMWVIRRDAAASVRARADALVRVKPRIAIDAAVEAVEEIGRLRRARAAEAVA